MDIKQRRLQERKSKTRRHPLAMAGTGLVETVLRSPILRPMPQVARAADISREARLRRIRLMKARRRAVSLRTMATMVMKVALGGTRLSADRARIVRRMPEANLHWS